ncbi:regulator of G-protein signaling 14 [Gastrophryne carolinensis]
MGGTILPRSRACTVLINGMLWGSLESCETSLIGVGLSRVLSVTDGQASAGDSNHALKQPDVPVAGRTSIRKHSLQFLEFSVWEGKNTRSRLSSLRNKFRASKSFYMSRSLEKREMLAVSDGELNHADSDGRGSDQSLNSLPSVQTSGLTSEHSVASWAVSFERLLQDPVGIEYFTEFLNKEYSAENIHFWKSCEKFQTISEADTEQLLQESRRIYDEYLSSSSMCPVNVDQQALVTEEMLEKPTPHLFKAQQQQIFNLMKFDSYARFVKSPLYQECMLSEVEGRPLPAISSSPNHHPTDCSSYNSDCSSLYSDCSSHHSGAVKKKSLRSGKSLPLGVESASMEVSLKHSRRSFKKKDRNSHVRDTLDSNGQLTRGESDGSLNSATSLDLSTMSAFSGRSENDMSSTNSLEREVELKQFKYCCVYLPDGTASLTAVRPGLSIREMLFGVCEKRGYNPTDIKVYLTGNDQKALALDQDCMVLSDQEVKLENRISFELQIESLNKNLHIVAKPTKTIHEALLSILKKYGLESQHFVLKKMNEPEAVDQGNLVSQVAGLTLILKTTTDMRDHVKTEHSGEAKKEKTGLNMPRPDFHHWTKKDHHHTDHASNISKHSQCSHVRNRPNRPNTDIEGLVEILNRVQCSRADDQRGLLSKEDLVLPEFLRLPTDETCDHCQMTFAGKAPTLLETYPSGPDASPENCSEQTPSKDTKPSSSETPCLPQIDNEIFKNHQKEEKNKKKKSAFNFYKDSLASRYAPSPADPHRSLYYPYTKITVELPLLI